MKCLPQSITLETAYERHPMALHNANLTWVTTTGRLQAIGSFQQITPAWQTGVLLGRSMADDAVATLDF